MSRPPLPHAVVRLNPKRGDGDCAIATLASYFRLDYEEVLIAASKVSKTVWKAGLHCPEIIKVANKLGIKVKWLKHFSIDDDAGVLWVGYNDRDLEHLALLDEGRIYELDHNPVSVWDADQYLGHYNAVPKLLLVKVDDD